MSKRKYKGKRRNKRFRTYRKKKMKNKIRNSTIKLKKNIKKMNASIIRVRKRILQKLKKQYRGGALGDENKEREGKFWQCKNCNTKIPNKLYNSNKGKKCETSTCKSIVNETNYNLVESEPRTPGPSKLVPSVTPGDLLPNSPSSDTKTPLPPPGPKTPGPKTPGPKTPGPKDPPEDDDDDNPPPPPGPKTPGPKTPGPKDPPEDDDDDNPPPPGPKTPGPKDPKPLDETKEFGGKVSDDITKNPTETNPLLNPDREGKNRGQIYYHTGVTIESAATYTQGQVDKKLAEIENTVKDNLKRSEDEDDDDDSDYDPNEDSDSDSDDEDHDLASKKIVLTLIKSQPS